MTSAAYADLCPGCLTDKGTASICPHCGYDESLKRGPLVLPHRALLHQGQYLIGKVLGKPGGFGITYLALDTRLETRVAIKEYLPRDLAGRDGGHATISAHSAEDGEFFRYGLTQFLQEARTLAKFDHANIVRVRNFFEENGTGYLVMDYYDGITLADYLAQQPQGKLPEKTAVGILMPILDGLREVHAKNFLHRDIKPQNIYLTTGNRPILLDFGAARQAMGERSRSISVVLSEGYAPYEQYHRRGEQGPWTDIYACAAVLYHAVAGEAPPPATERVHKDELDIAALGVSASLAEALRLGLAVDHTKRPQRMTEFQALLLGDGETFLTDVVTLKSKKVELSTPAVIVAQRPNKPTQSKSPSGWMIWWAPVSAVLIVIVMVAMLFTKEEKGEVPIIDAPVLVAPEAEIKPVTEVDGQQAKGGLVTYAVEKIKDEPLGRHRLVATLDGKRLEGPEDDYVNIEAQKDFNGDGIMDALIKTSCGGSGCYPRHMFVSIINSKIVVAQFTGSQFAGEWDGFQVKDGVVEEGGRFLVKAESDDVTVYWGFDGKKAIKVRSIPHRKLKPIAETQYNPSTVAPIPVAPKVEMKTATKVVSSQSYVISTNGTEVTDKKTGLIWRRCAEGMVSSSGICTGTASGFDYDAALQHAAAQASSTGSAWRIPNKEELSSIIDKNFSDPMIDPTAFPATPSGAFWSSPIVGNSSYAWSVNFDSGVAGYSSRSYSNYVRLVRAGQ